MNRKLLLLAMVSTLAIAACKPQAPAEPAAPAQPAQSAAPPAPVAVESAPSSTAADVPFDMKGFAGTFTGTMPCADCPGIDTKLVLNADGTYKLHESYRDKPDGDFDSEGTWTAEEDGRRIRLDPNSKSNQDRLFAVKGNNEIESLDLEGKPITTTMPHSLKRDDMMGGSPM
jgi:copper homeostasis protein (lipoprotein)